MSDLQISLLIIGAVVVGVVYLFNYFQERKLRRKLERAFESGHEDVLLDAPPPEQADHRIEPQMPRAGFVSEAGVAAGQVADIDVADPAGESGAEVLPEPPGFDRAIDYVAQIEAKEFIADAVIGELLNRLSAIGKPVRSAGLNPDSLQWEFLDDVRSGQYRIVRFAMQLVNRGGVAHAAQLVAFCDLIRDRAGKASGVATLPDVEATLEAARKLDDFCADVDVAIGVNIIAAKGMSFAGTKIRGLAEAAGFKLESEGVFHFRNDQRQTLFTLDNHEPAPFIPEQIKSLSTIGITLLLDVPRVGADQQALDTMLEVAKGLEQGLGGRLVDDNRVALNASGIAKIKQQLGAIQSKMDAHGISAGSERALRLFS